MVPSIDELASSIGLILSSALEETGEVWLWYNRDGSWDVDQYDNTSYEINCVVDDLEGATAVEIATDLISDLEVEISSI